MQTATENGNDRTPKPQRRLWRTRFKWPRKLRGFAPEITLDDVASKQPDEAEIAHWGEFVLLEDDIAVLHRDGTTSWLNHVITMPWGDQNLSEWDERSLVFEPRKWYPTLRKAVVHLPDGTRRKAKKMIAPVSSTERVMSLTFAPLRPGVIVEFEEQQDFFEPGEAGPHLWGQFFLESQVPCAIRRVTVAIAHPLEAEFELYHTDRQPVESDEQGYHVYRWELCDLAGVETDAWTPPPRDFAAWADISTLRSWGPIARHYRKELVPSRGTPSTVKELTRDLTKDCKTDREKALAVHRYTARDVRYGRHPSEQMLHTIREPVKMLEDLRGDCKDKSSLMVMMFGELNIPAKIVLVLTAQNGRTPMLPSLRFDHAIVAAELDGLQVWFDPASGPFSFGDLPQNDQGVKALMLDGDQPSWIDIPEDPPEKQRVQRICEGDLTETGDYRFRAEITAHAERAAFYRTVLQDRSDNHRRRMIQQAVAEERPGTAVDDVDVGDVEDLDSPVSYRYRAHLTRWARMIEDLMLFRIPWAEPIDFTGPVSAAERLQPLQMPSTSRLFERHEIDLPAGFAGYGLPFEVHLTCPWGEYRCQVVCENGRLSCERQMDNLGGIVPTKDFAEFKTFWEECARSDRADVVLVRRKDDAAEG